MPKSKSTAVSDASEFENYLTIQEAAALIKNARTGKRGVSRQRALVLVREGRITAVKKGRDWFVKRADALAFEPFAPHRPESKKGDENTT